MNSAGRCPQPQLLISAISCLAISYLCYSLFYHFSSIIWSFGQRLPLAEYTPWVRRYVQENDGIELFVFYPMVFAALFGAFACHRALETSVGATSSRAVLYPGAVAASALYLWSIRFVPPMAAVAQGSHHAIFMVSVLLGTGGLSWLLLRHKAAAHLALIVLLVPVCSIATSRLFLIDFGYILAPALRIAKGVSPRDIYFQYDYLLSLLLVFWMKLALPVLRFQLMGSLSYLALFLGAYALAYTLFKRKVLAVHLVLAMVVVRMYGNMDDPLYLMQVTPLRLDFWLLPLALVCWKGPSHWAIGGTLALLTILHHNFGVIYAVSYLLLVLFLIGIEAVDCKGDVWGAVSRQASRYAGNGALIVVAMAIYRLFVASRIANAALYYQQAGLGFLRIYRSSFYWYVIPMLSATFTLLLIQRKRLAAGYFRTGLFLLVLAIGNSLYFFGRSHENNIINISSVLLFVLFFGFDLVDFELAPGAAHRAKRFAMPAVSIVFILLCAHYYSGRAIRRLSLQYAALKEGRFIREDHLPDLNTRAIRAVVGPSAKVIFVSGFDAFYCLESGSRPEGYFGLIPAWIVKKDLVGFLNERLADGDYLAVPSLECGDGYVSEIVDSLALAHRKNVANFVILSNHAF